MYCRFHLRGKTSVQAHYSMDLDVIPRKGDEVCLPDDGERVRNVHSVRILVEEDEDGGYANAYIVLTD